MGPKVILVTSFKDDLAGGEPHTGMLVSNGAEMYQIQTPELPFPAIVAGSGDITAALFLSYYLTTIKRGASGSMAHPQQTCLRQALERVTASIYSIMEATYKAGAGEILLIGTQEAPVNPGRMFDAYRFNA
jgi:pyridoxine kinase